MADTLESKPGVPSPGSLQRNVGFFGLMFVSLGSIIGSGWLLSALNALKHAGPAAVLSWVLAAAMLTALALVYAELGAAYPVAGGSGRFTHFSHGALAGFSAGWFSWLQAVAIAPIEILAAITYVDSTNFISKHFPMIHTSGVNAGLLNPRGIIVATILMVLFTAMNLAGAKFMSESNSLVVIWKTLVPLLAIIVVVLLSFHAGNFSLHPMKGPGGFAPFGAHGVFAALPLGVVFALQGFEQAVQLAGEARNPKKDISRAIITAMSIGALLYIALQIAFLVGLKPGPIMQNGWAGDILPGGAASSYGAWYTLSIAVGASWLGAILIIDAVISPSGTGIVYIGTTSRLTYALGRVPELPTKLASTNRRGVPVWAILVSAVVGELCFGPFPSWNKLVGVVTGATAMMYAFAPVSLGALRKNDPDRDRPYNMPMPAVLLPVAFISANLVLYWGGYEFTWKIAVAYVIGLILFFIGMVVKKSYDPHMFRHAFWIAPWLIGNVIIGYFGRYGDGAKNSLPDWWDLATVTAFSLVIYYLAISVGQPKAAVQESIADDLDEIESGDVLNVPIA